MSFFQWLERAGVTSHPGGWAATERMLANLDFNAKDLAVELGCGHGRTLTYVAKRFGVRVVGVDLMPALASIACNKLKKERLTGFAISADVCRLPFRNGTFQTAWAESVFVFLPKPDAFIEVERVLKPKGKLGMVELAWKDEPKPEYCKRTRDFLGVQRYEVLTVNEWVAMLQSSGFEVKVAEKLPGHTLPSTSLLSDWWDLIRLAFGLARQLPASKWLEGAKAIAALFNHTVPAVFVAVKGG